MSFFRLVVLFTLSGLLLSGCAVPTKSRVAADKQAFSAVSFASGAFKPVSGDTIAWHGPPVWADPALRETRPEFDAQLQSAVDGLLGDRGYTLIRDRSNADFLIGVGVLTQGGENSAAIKRFFRVFPQVSRSAAGFDKGVIVAGIIAAEDRAEEGSAPEADALLWRSGVKAFVVDLPQQSAERKARLTRLAAALMKSVPAVSD